MGIWRAQMVFCRGWAAIVLSAAVCIAASSVEESDDALEESVFDRIAPLLTNSASKGELGESMKGESVEDPSKGAESKFLEKTTHINKLLRKAESSKVGAVLDKHFTEDVWTQWVKEV